MRKIIFTLLFLVMALTSFGQAKTEWKEGYRLSISDFQAVAPKSREGIGQSYALAANLDFGYAMSSYEFMLTKNFNKNVTTFFIPANSWMQPGDATETLLKYAQMDFDLLELYARKYRQRLYAEKNPFSNLNFFQLASSENNAEMNKRHVEMQNAVAESEVARDTYHAQILKEISELADYCKECKPVKKKK